MAITKLNRSLNLGFSNLNLLYDALAKDDPLMSFLGKAVADMNVCSFMHAHFITTSARTEGWKNVTLLRGYRDSLRGALDNVLVKLLPGDGQAFLDKIGEGQMLLDGKAARLLGAAFLDGGDELAVHVFEDILAQDLLREEEA